MNNLKISDSEKEITIKVIIQEINLRLESIIKNLDNENLSTEQIDLMHKEMDWFLNLELSIRIFITQELRDSLGFNSGERSYIK